MVRRASTRIRPTTIIMKNVFMVEQQELSFMIYNRMETSVSYTTAFSFFDLFEFLHISNLVPVLEQGFDH